MKVVYFSITGQTRRFIKKLDIDDALVYEIKEKYDPVELNSPYILIVPTYDAPMTQVVNNFIEFKSNRANLKGVVGSGNRNFGDLFVFTAKDIARDYDVPLLYSYEFNGTTEDVENVKKAVSNLES